MTSVLTPARPEEHASRAQTPPATSSERRVLIVVDEPCTAPDLCASVRTFADDLPFEALVVAPAHGRAVATQWYVDEDAARADATYRLRGCVECLRRAGIRVHGRLGDRDPVLAIADALHEFPADVILIVTTPQRPARWLRRNVIDRARHTFKQPVEHIAMPPATEPRST